MQNPTLDAHGVAVLLLIVAALILFTRERLPLEASSLTVLIVLTTGFYFFPYNSDGVPLGPDQFFAAFGNEALISVCALLIIGKGLETTGALRPVAMIISNTWSIRPMLALLLMLLAVALLSAFVNDTPIVVLMIPILVGISLRAKLPASKMLLPMGLATIIGGMSTTIGTSTNLLVVGIAEDLGLDRFSVFEFVQPVLIVGGFGLAYVWIVVPRLIPQRDLPMTDTKPRIFSAQLLIKEGSIAADKSLSEVLARTKGEMKIESVRRSDTLFLAKLPTTRLQVGDRLFLRDTAENLKRFEDQLNATLYSVSDTEHPINDATPLTAEGQQLAELVITGSSPLHMRTLGDARIAERYNLLPLAVHRARSPGTKVAGDIDKIRMRAGDVLLVQGSRNSIDALKVGGDALVLDGTTNLPSPHHAKRALAAFAFVVATAALGIMPISLSALIGVGLMLATGCLTWRDAARSLPTAVIMIIVASLALGKALVGTGTAEFLAAGFVGIASGLPPAVILSAFMLTVAVLTNIVSNNAAAVIGTPIAIATANQLGVDPVPFVLAVLFGANMSFVTPFGYQTNLLIMSAGGYRFTDFVRAGLPLAIIMWAGFSLVLPLFYDLNA